jgi:hypothetical protein
MSSPFQYWYWKNILNLKNIKKLNKFILSNYSSLEEEKYKAKDNNNVIKKHLNTFLISYTKIKPYISKLIDDCYLINKKNFGYDLWNIDNGICNYNIYKSENKDNYGWHVDASGNPYSDIKLTVLINLSESNFEGGDFYIQDTNEHKIDELKETGSMVMFKSNIRHMVTPVTKGIRKNLAIFLEGPNFK